MIETLIISLVLAAISGLTFIAYKHPDGYKNLATPMLIVGLMIALVSVATKMGGLWWLIGNIAEELVKKPDQSLADVEFTIRRLAESKDDIQKILAVALPTIAYLVFLWHLPNVLGVNKDNERKVAEPEVGQVSTGAAPGTPPGEPST